MPITFPISYPEELPLSHKVGEIKEAIEQNQVLIIGGETGSGKTTQLPKICLDMGRGRKAQIAHTQPRRLAARSVCQRIAEELQVEVGKEVGYQVRFNNLSNDQTCIKLMTDGILLAEIQQDPLLKKYDTVIIDEAHERSLNIDFLLGYLKNLLPQRPDLKLLITSATIDLDKFSAHFNKAPIIEVSGRTYPVDIIYQPQIEAEGVDLADNIITAVKALYKLERKQGNEKKIKHGDILIFLSGEREITDVAQALRKEKLNNTEILPLYARLSNKEQNRVFQSHPGRRIVLSTNVAETSITVPGITGVIDPGSARISRYSVRSKVQRLPIEAISQASANQRAGRCGRIAPGICIRLYSEDDYSSRPEFTDTEITRTNLASVILQMLKMGLGDIDKFPFLDKPESKAINDGLKVLEELGAINEDGALNKTGKLMAELPVDPRYARMLLEASTKNCLTELLIIVSAISVQDPRERPLDKQQAADEKHRLFQHPQSDFLGFLKLWQYFEGERQQLTQNQLRKYCQRHFLSYLRMREWREIHRQLHLQCRKLGFTENSKPADEAYIHQSILRGLIVQIARQYDGFEYQGTRNRKFQIFPGSSLFKKKSKWILAAELVETTKLYGRLNCQIKPEWVEEAAGTLLNHEYFEQHWEKRRGQVMAFEKVSLYGLTLVERRKVSFSKIDPLVSRELFIRCALIALDMRTGIDFYQHNQQLIEKVSELEDKTRRRDILVDEEALFEFYDRLLPTHIFSTRNLERWYSKLDKKHKTALFLSEQDLISKHSADFDINEYPDQLTTPSMALKLDYEFAPGKASDGISVDVPVSALKQLKEEDLDWLVPGMLREKCIGLAKALPKPIRKLLVPIPDLIDQIMPALKTQATGNLRYLLAQKITAKVGVPLDPQQWKNYKLDEHLQMQIRVLDETGNVLGSGRDLAELQEQFADEIQRNIQLYSENSLERSGITSWNIGELEEVHEIEHGGIKLLTYPALVDEIDSVALTLCDNLPLAKQETVWGIVRLLMLNSSQQIKYLKKALLNDNQKNLLLSHLGKKDEIQQQLIRAAYRNCFLNKENLPRTEQEFNAVYEENRGDLISIAEKLESKLYEILQHFHRVKKLLLKVSADESQTINIDVGDQLDELLHADFICDTPRVHFIDIPRYLKAIEERLEKYPRQIEKDKEWTKELQSYFSLYSQQYDLLVKQNMVSHELEKFRWLLEEYRVSLFAQSMGTKEPISAKRLKKFWTEKVLNTNT
ncbi:MAG: ATP-dependent RNA helicase HrpA [Gammaproteobacteria bacterium]|nr:ATP-dependent RNA helicase HrpA [Gammaproteobacteria bacterium]